MNPDQTPLSGISRRGALQAGVLCLGSAAVPCVARGGAAVTAPLAEMARADVVLAAGPAADQMAQTQRLVMGLDEDALLKPFRVRGGLAAPGPDMGGWYDTDAFAPAHSFGQWVSALARGYGNSGDAAAKAKAQRLIGLYGQSLTADGGFYRHNRFPAYTYDKLTAGLLDAHVQTGAAEAMPLLARTTDIALPYLPPRAQPRDEHAKEGEDFTRHAWDESYTLAENQFLAWKAGAGDRHLGLAKRFLYDDFFLALARGQNVLPGKHAYSHVNALSSAAQAYLSLGARPYLQAAQAGLAFAEAQSYATGGWGPDEHFITPGTGALGRSLTATKQGFETPCGAHAHLKLGRYLLRITRQSHYGDSMERVLYNTVLGATPIAPDGRAFYYSDYGPRARKATFGEPWPCCTGSLPLLAADHGLNMGFTDPVGVYVNLYLPGEMGWRQNGRACRLTIATQYPYADTVAVTVEAETDHPFSVFLRIPAWAKGATLAVGDGPARPVAAGAFSEIRRDWRRGGRLRLCLPANPRLEAVDAQNPNLVALMSGPLALMRVFDSADAAPMAVSREALLAAAHPRPGSSEWHAHAGAKHIELRPFMDIRDQTYSLYQELT